MKTLLNKVKGFNIENVDVEGLEKDNQVFSLGVGLLAISMMIAMGPKEYLKMVYKPKNFVTGSLLGLLGAVILVIKNYNNDTNE